MTPRGNRTHNRRAYSHTLAPLRHSPIPIFEIICVLKREEIKIIHFHFLNTEKTTLSPHFTSGVHCTLHVQHTYLHVFAQVILVSLSIFLLSNSMSNIDVVMAQILGILDKIMDSNRSKKGFYFYFTSRCIPHTSRAGRGNLA